MSRICAIILAAGESKRMGRNKLLLSFQGKPIIHAVIELAMQAGMEQILVVLGAFREELLPVIEEFHVKHCYNNNYKQGMLSSVQCGFLNLPDGIDAAILFLGDQPMIPLEAARRLAEAYEKSKKGIIVPVYGDKRGHPLLIDMKYYAAIAKLDHATGLRALLVTHAEDVLEVQMDLQEILRDIDNEQDYLYEISLK
jgi:molybdenum cofactor cytidylyltransferase